MKSSKRADLIQPSLTRKFFNLAKQYNDVIDLTLGDPDLPPPFELYSKAYNAMSENKMHYSANAGLIQAREAVASNLKRNWGIQANPLDNIIITVGGMEALYLSMLSIIDEGDEVIVFAPYYVNYFQIIELCGGKPVIVNILDFNNNFCINKEIINGLISEKTCAIILNSPNNPTGEVFDIKSLRLIYDIAQEHNLAIISDEVYRTLIYDKIKHESILQFDGACDQTILIDSLSKEFSMTGYRIGYAYGPSDIIANMTKLQENIVACAPVSSQHALITAYSNRINNGYILDEFQKRRDFLFNELSSISYFKVLKPKGTFYMFVNIAGTQLNSEEFTYFLLKNAHIAVVPGIAYGDSYDNYIRIAFTKDIHILNEAVNRIRDVFNVNA